MEYGLWTKTKLIWPTVEIEAHTRQPSGVEHGAVLRVLVKIREKGHSKDLLEGGQARPHTIKQVVS